SIASRPGSMYPCAHCRRLPYFICIAGIPRLSRLRALGRDDNGGVVADPNARPAHVLTARWSDDVAAMIDESAPQEGALHPTGEMEALEGRVTLLGFRLVGAYHESLMRVDQRNVGVKARSNIALVAQAEPLRRVPAQKLGHVVVGHAALAAFT